MPILTHYWQHLHEMTSLIQEGHIEHRSDIFYSEVTTLTHKWWSNDKWRTSNTELTQLTQNITDLIQKNTKSDTIICRKETWRLQNILTYYDNHFNYLLQYYFNMIYILYRIYYKDQVSMLYLEITSRRIWLE